MCGRTLQPTWLSFGGHEGLIFPSSSFLPPIWLASVPSLQLILRSAKTTFRKFPSQIRGGTDSSPRDFRDRKEGGVGAVECSRALPLCDLNGEEKEWGPFLYSCPTSDWPPGVHSECAAGGTPDIDVLLLLINNVSALRICDISYLTMPLHEYFLVLSSLQFPERAGQTLGSGGTEAGATPTCRRSPRWEVAESGLGDPGAAPTVTPPSSSHRWSTSRSPCTGT